MVDRNLYESYLPTKDIDEIRTLVRYRKSLGEENTKIKNKYLAILSLHGIKDQYSDIYIRADLFHLLKPEYLIYLNLTE